MTSSPLGKLYFTQKQLISHTKKIFSGEVHPSSNGPHLHRIVQPISSPENPGTTVVSIGHLTPWPENLGFRTQVWDNVTYCINGPGKPGICFHYHCAVYDECKYSDTFWLADRTRLFVQYTILLSSLCKLIWRHWTYKMAVRYILSSVWVRLSIFSPLSIMQYVGLYVFSWPISLVMIERIYILCLIVIIKSEVWTITHCV